MEWKLAIIGKRFATWLKLLLPFHHVIPPGFEINVSITMKFPNFVPTCPRVPQSIHHRIFLNFTGKHRDILYLSDIQTSCLRWFPVSILDCARFLLMVSCPCETGVLAIAMSKYRMKINTECGTGPEANNVYSNSKVWEVVQSNMHTYPIYM